MKNFARDHGFTFPYLYDESQEVARAYDAVCTPDFFGFNGKLELQYRGRLDASRKEAGQPMPAADCSRRWLRSPTPARARVTKLIDGLLHQVESGLASPHPEEARIAPS